MDRSFRPTGGIQLLSLLLLLLFVGVGGIMRLGRRTCKEVAKSLEGKQHCDTHPIRVSFLVFVFSYLFHIDSFCSQSVTKQFASSRHQSKGHAVSCLDRFLFHLKLTSQNILLLTADKSVLVKTSPVR